MNWSWPSYVAGVLTIPAIFAGLAVYFFYKVTKPVTK